MSKHLFDDPIIATTALYANSFRTIQPSINSTGLRAHPLRCDAVRGLRDRSVAEEFLIASRLRRHDVEFEMSVASHFTESASAMLALLGTETRRGLRTIPLPRSHELQLAFGEAVRRRRSVRSYTGDPVPLAYVATIVRAACGVTGHIHPKDGKGTRLALRATPSAGGLYPVEIHLVALRVEGLQRGAYVYDPKRDVLWQTGDQTTVDALLGALAAPDQVIRTSQAAAMFLLIGRVGRAMRKYGARGMRHLFLEAGAIAAHINLAAVALGVGSVDSSSVYDDEAHEALEVDGLYEALLHSIVLGIPA